MYEFCGFRFDPENHSLERDGNPVLLTPKGFEILLVLVRNGSKLTTKEELMRTVWPDSFVEAANLTVNISALRRQLGETPKGQQYIETVPKKGYRFAVPITQIETNNIGREEGSPAAESALAGLEVDPASNGTAVPRARTKARLGSRILLLGLIVLALAGLGYVAYRYRRVRQQATHAARRLAVLPFQNLQQDPNTDFLGYSLADAVITKLGYVSELSVRPSYAVQKYRSQVIDIPKAAADLNVDTLLTGTYLRDDDELRIACQLIDVKTENLLWKGSFDLKYDKLLSVQDTVASQVIEGLQLTLSPSEQDRLKAEATVNPAAYEYYLRGVDLYARGDFPAAVNMLEKSTELAPRFAPSWANLGKSYSANASFELGGAEHYRKAEAAFARALEIQPDELEAQIYMANMLTDTGRVEQAVPLLRGALKTNPNKAEIHWELSYAYRFAGMLKESVAEGELARQLDPGVKLNSSALNAYLYLGEYDRFLASLPRTDNVAFIVFYRGFGEYYKKHWQEAEKNFDHAYDVDRSVLQAIIGKALSSGLKGERQEGVARLQALEATIRQRGVMDPEAIYKIAQAYAQLGDKASGLRVLRHSIENGFFSYPYLATDPLLDALRKEDGFSSLMDAARQRHASFKRRFLPDDKSA
ncbi:MAG: winged helix-turn-helix domain-containing protein [Acidobacteriaceae bacterium]|nr:winged helix-turn-helix domain-containing protein [Acidobacteriaceae bacterium]